MILILLSICLTGCTGNVFGTIIEKPINEPIGGVFHADPIYGVFYDDETG